MRAMVVSREIGIVEQRGEVSADELLRQTPWDLRHHRR